MTDYNRFLIFFRTGTTLVFKVGREIKTAGDICKRALDIEFEQDGSVGLGAILGDGQKIKNYLSSFRDFFEKSLYCHIVGLRSHFSENRNLKFSFM